MAIKRVQDPDDGAGATPDRALRQALAAIKLGRFGIEPGDELGLDLLWRAPADTKPDEPNRFSFEEPGHGGATAGVPYYEIEVQETKIADQSVTRTVT